MSTALDIGSRQKGPAIPYLSYFSVTSYVDFQGPPLARVFRDHDLRAQTVYEPGPNPFWFRTLRTIFLGQWGVRP